MRVTIVLSALYGALALVVAGVMVYRVSQDLFNVASLFLAFMAVMYLFAGIIHERRITVLYGLHFLVSIPMAYCLLPIYAVMHSHETSWGTRDKKATDHSAPAAQNVNVKMSTSGAGVDSPADFEEDYQTEHATTAQNKMYGDWRRLVGPRGIIGTRRFQRAEKENVNLKSRMQTLRFMIVVALFVMNAIWLLAVWGMSLVTNQPSIRLPWQPEDAPRLEVISAIYLGLFALLFGIQVIGMLIHRSYTFLHKTARVSIFPWEVEQEEPVIPMPTIRKDAAGKTLALPAPSTATGSTSGRSSLSKASGGPGSLGSSSGSLNKLPAGVVNAAGTPRSGSVSGKSPSPTPNSKPGTPTAAASAGQQRKLSQESPQMNQQLQAHQRRPSGEGASPNPRVGRSPSNSSDQGSGRPPMAGMSPNKNGPGLVATSNPELVGRPRR
jgi:hypothetical protein